MTTRSDEHTENLHVLGTGKLPERAGPPGPHFLESFPNRYPERLYIIRIAYPEFTSLCPVTSQPDFGEIVTEYIPDTLCVESKSFKLYMLAFRNHGAFMESIVNTVLNDLVHTLSPRWCRVQGLFAPRGATHLHVFAEEFKTLTEEENTPLRRTVEDWKRETHPRN